MLRKLFSGQYSVTQTYWLGFVGFNLLMRGVFLVLPMVLLPLYLAERDLLADAIASLILIAGLVYCALLLRGQYRAMYHHRSPSFWSWLGMLLIGVGMLGYGYSLVIMHVDGVPVSEKFVREEVRGLNLAMPADVAPGIVATRVSYFHGVYTFHYSYAFDDMEPGRFDMFEGEEAEDVCREFEGYFRGPVKRLEFHYAWGGHNTVIYMTRQACLNALDAKENADHSG